MLFNQWLCQEVHFPGTSEPNYNLKDEVRENKKQLYWLIKAHSYIAPLGPDVGNMKMCAKACGFPYPPEADGIRATEFHMH